MSGEDGCLEERGRECSGLLRIHGRRALEPHVRSDYPPSTIPFAGRCGSMCIPSVPRTLSKSETSSVRDRW